MVSGYGFGQSPRRTARKKGSGYENAPHRARSNARKKGSGSRIPLVTLGRTCVRRALGRECNDI
jgi:hypothetical protein